MPILCRYKEGGENLKLFYLSFCVCAQKKIDLSLENDC